MAFVTGMFLIDAPASALNNLGQIPGARTDNQTGVKLIRARDGAYPYVSAQAFRYWLRTTLEQGPWGWKAAPVYREEKVAYTDANPIRYWDDDLFGYMRAPSKKESAKAAREADAGRARETPTAETVTRISPLRISTLVSLGPVSLVEDLGVMARHDGDPVLHEHQFYRTTLHGLLSLDLHASGTFSYRERTGYLNLDGPRKEEAIKMKLEHIAAEKAYRLSFRERAQRIATLLEGLAHLDGGAKRTIHYTDVSPDLVLLAVTRGGNNLFGHVAGVDAMHRPVIKLGALKEALQTFAHDLLSAIYVGWTEGYLDEQRALFTKALESDGELAVWRARIRASHPHGAFQALAADLGNEANAAWLT
jgi:CRISPR-associated protein Cst2